MTVTVTATVDTSNTPQRVILSVAATTETSTTVTRINPDGTVVPVRTFDGNPTPISGGAALAYDYEPWYGQPAVYSSLESPTVYSSPVTVDPGGAWLVHPGVPSLSIPIELRAGSLDEESLPVNQGVFWAMGRRTPIVVTDGTRRSAQASLTVATETLDDVEAIRALVSDASTLLLNIPPSLGFGFGTSYVAIADIKIQRLSTVGADEVRNVVMPFTVVDMPVGGSQAQRTYTDLLAYTSYSTLRAAYSSYTALLAGP